MPPEVIDTISGMRARAEALRSQGRSIGFVPTMGALHEGHLSLMRRSRAENDVSVISIFVNPTQFAPTEDFDEYPRPFGDDLKKAGEVGVDLVFTTTSDEMYPQGYSTYVVEDRITKPLCGRSRPIFFRGVLTVVLKLFQIVTPHRAYFGEKDYQQYMGVRKMVDDLNLGIQVIPCPIVREDDGLALSSRNAYLDRAERSEALVVPRSLDVAAALIAEGIRDPLELARRMREGIEESPAARVDYVEALRAADLAPLEELEGEVVVAVAVWIGKTRLIDNRVISVGEP